MLEHERPKLDRYRSHLFLTAYGVHLDSGTGELATSELSAFITPRALITVRKDDGLDIGAVDRPLGLQRGPGQARGRLSAARADRLHRGRALRGRAGPGRLHRDPGGPAVLRRPDGPRGAAAQLRAAQEPGPAAPGGPAHARGGQHPDAARPAHHRRRPAPVLPGRLRPRAAGHRVDREPAGPGHHHPGDQPDHPGQPAERDHQEGDQLGRDHRGAHVDHRLLRDERALPRVRQARGVLAAVAIIIVTAGLVLYLVFKRKDWL